MFHATPDHAMILGLRQSQPGLENKNVPDSDRSDLPVEIPPCGLSSALCAAVARPFFSPVDQIPGPLRSHMVACHGESSQQQKAAQREKKKRKLKAK